MIHCHHQIMELPLQRPLNCSLFTEGEQLCLLTRGICNETASPRSQEGIKALQCVSLCKEN